MGMRGPPPNNSHTLRARGSRLAKKRAAEEAAAGSPGFMVAPVERPDCPDWLDGEARAEWERQLDALAELGAIAKVDRAALAAWCEAWAEFVECCNQIRAGKRVVEGAKPGSLVISPWVRMKNHAVDRLIKLGAQFGFTVAARSRIRAVESGLAEPEPDELEKFMERGAAAKAANAAHRDIDED